MAEYHIPQEAAHLVAVGLYRQIGAFIKEADQADYMRFKAEYLAKQAAEAAPPVKRRQSRKQAV